MSPTTREGGLSALPRAVVGSRLPAVLRSPTLQGFVFTAPLLLLFAAFVVYPMLSGLYAATDPDSYRAIFGDPVAASMAPGPVQEHLVETVISGRCADTRLWS